MTSLEKSVNEVKSAVIALVEDEVTNINGVCRLTEGKSCCMVVEVVCNTNHMKYEVDLSYGHIEKGLRPLRYAILNMLEKIEDCPVPVEMIQFPLTRDVLELYEVGSILSFHKSNCIGDFI